MGQWNGKGEVGRYVLQGVVMYGVCRCVRWEAWCGGARVWQEGGARVRHAPAWEGGARWRRAACRCVQVVVARQVRQQAAVRAGWRERQRYMVRRQVRAVLQWRPRLPTPSRHVAQRQKNQQERRRHCKTKKSAKPKL